MFDYCGAFHCHTEFSFDCKVPMQEIIDAANRAGMDFVMINDHFRIDAKEKGFEGWFGQTLLVVGEEISPHPGHYLAFNLKKRVVINKMDKSAQAYIDQVNDQGGFGIIAHPDHQGTKLFRVKPYFWRDWGVSGYTGIGVWDLMTDFQEGTESILTALRRYFFTPYFLRGPKKETLNRWDNLNQERRVVGIGEIDNHNTRIKLGVFSFYVFKYDFAFRTIRTHALLEQEFTGEKEADIGMLYAAIKRGHLYISLDYWKNARGFKFCIFDNEHEAIMGDDFVLQGSALLEVKLPERGKIRVIRNGVCLQEIVHERLEIDVKEKGVYRIEVWQKRLFSYHPWIYSNPIRVG